MKENYRGFCDCCNILNFVFQLDTRLSRCEVKISSY